jgi:hypothetical protein
MQTHHFKSHILATLALVILVGSLVLSGTLVGHSQGQGFASVKVVNTSAEPVPVTGAGGQPIPVQVVDDFAAKTPFRDGHIAVFDDGSPGEAVFFDVTEGKRLVIEHVSVSATLPIGQKIAMELVIPVGLLSGIPYSFVVTTVGTFPIAGSNKDMLVASQQVRLYADVGFNVNLKRNNSSGTGSAVVSISGHLVDAN